MILMKQNIHFISARNVQGRQHSENADAQPQIVGSDAQTAIFFYNNGMVKAYPHNRLKLDIDAEVLREYDPALGTDLARIDGHLLVSNLGYFRFEPETPTATPATATAHTPASGAKKKGGIAIPATAAQKGRHAVRTKVAETACGIVREGSDDYTVYVRAPKAMLSSLGIDVATFFQAEFEKLMVQMDVDQNYGLTA